MAIINHCKDCIPPQRHPGCHSHCEKYAIFKQHLAIQKQKERELDPLREYTEAKRTRYLKYEHRKMK